MKNIKTTLYIAIAIIFFTGCRLDESLFNPNSNKISSYNLDGYTGEVDFKLDASYQIPSNLVNLFTLQSKAADETAATKIFAIYIGNIQRIATDTVILYCHGNKDHMDFYWPRAQLLANTKSKNRYGVLMIDYRGYGLSEGKPTEKGLYADVDAAMQWLKSNGLTNNRLVVYGFSMGTAPATKLTAEPQSMIPSKVMLEAPMASAEVMVQVSSGLALPGSFATDLKINNAELIKKVQQPLFWIHGVKDDFLPINAHGELVYKNHTGIYKEAHRIQNADHSNVPIVFGFQNYLKAVGDFISR
ncbi:MAG: alpha/beta hydrolase [Chitinophagaceae bacterium]